MSSPVELQQFKHLLRENGRFVTIARLRLFGILQSHPALTLKELIALTHKHDQVTVYRNIDLFEKLGIINRFRLGWNTKIELSDLFRHHHHHLTCVSCGKIISLPEDNLIEKQINLLTVKKDFTPIDHQLEIRGYCSACKLRNPG